MTRIGRRRAGATALLAASLVLAAAVLAAGSAAKTTRAGGAASAQAVTITAHASRYGKILFDGRGRVLYLFARDRAGRSSCSGACAKAWPPSLTKGVPKAGRGVSAKLLGTTKRKDGTLQVTYGKHPLYYIKEDTQAAKIMWQTASNFGSLWFVG